MKNTITVLPSTALACALVVLTLLQPARASLAAGVVGTGTPLSCNEDTLRAALISGGVVTFNCGGAATITLGEKIVVATDTSINGDGKIMISGGLRTQIFDVQAISALTLTNVVLTNALTIFSNGGAIVNKGRLYIDGVTFSDNSISPEYSGAAIFTSGVAEIFGSTFLNNDAGSAGAIFANTPGARVVISNSTFLNNSGLKVETGLGGAVLVGTGADMTIVDTTFSANRAILGGALYVTKGGRLTLRGSGKFAELTDNLARGLGGAIYSEGTLSVDNAAFRRNKTPTEGSLSNYGGAIASTGTTTITKSFFRENESRFGGAVYVGGTLNDARMHIDQSAFSKNRAVVLGGGLYTNVSTTTVTVEHSSFNANSAGSGGGIARMNANLAIANTSLTNNTATGGGGGLFVGAVPEPTSGGYVKVTNTTISGNSSANMLGGGVLNSARLELYHSTVVSNTQGIYRNLFGNTRLRGTVLQNPGFLNCATDGKNQLSDDSGNFATDTSCGVSKQGPELNPMLAPIMVDGQQPTWYHLPLKGSPLLNQLTFCPPTDQLSAIRSVPCAIGATEYVAPLAKTYLPLAARGALTAE
jgi:predicted outer membrane repeat protein